MLIKMYYLKDLPMFYKAKTYYLVLILDIFNIT